MELAKNKKLLIVGSPRAGTRFTYNLLNYLNIDVGHEQTKSQGAVSSLHIYTDEKFDFIGHQIREPLKCIASLHKINWQEKETLSWAADSGYFRMLSNDMKNNKASQSRQNTWMALLDRIKDGNMTRKCMKAYLEWNKAAKEMSTFTYKLEDIMDNLLTWSWWTSSLGLEQEIYKSSTTDGISDFDRAKLFRDRGLDTEDHLINPNNTVPNHTGRYVAPDLTWDMLKSLDKELSEKILDFVSPYYHYNEKGELVDLASHHSRLRGATSPAGKLKFRLT